MNIDSLKLKKISALWIIVILVLFIASIVLGILMRLNQGKVIEQSPLTFYTNMTTHGLTMIGIWFGAGMVAVNYLLQRYVMVLIFSHLSLPLLGLSCCGLQPTLASLVQDGLFYILCLSEILVQRVGPHHYFLFH